MGQYTGCAGNLLGGSTLHSMLGMGKGGNAKNPATIKEEFLGVNTVIIDEMSMWSLSFVKMMHDRLSISTGAPPSKPFGGLDMVVFGDMRQYRPLTCCTTARSAMTGMERHPPFLTGRITQPA